MKNIVLAGFMGCGKTAVGKLLAEKLGLEFIDTDNLIELQEKQTISDIFKTKGEKYFRDLEENIIKIISQKNGSIISIGGGSLQREANIAELKKNGFIILLMASTEEIIRRISQHQHRPLLQNCENINLRIEQLLSERKKGYDCADLKIDTTGLFLEEVVEKIIESINKVNLL